jgi:hypothetical protein
MLFHLNSSYSSANPRPGKGFSVVYCRIDHAKIIHGRKYVQDLFYITLVISYSIKTKLQVFCNLIKTLHRIHYFFCHGVRHLLFTWKFCNKSLKLYLNWFHLTQLSCNTLATKISSATISGDWSLGTTPHQWAEEIVILKYTSKWLEFTFWFFFWSWRFNGVSNTYSTHTNVSSSLYVLNGTQSTYIFIWNK